MHRDANASNGVLNPNNPFAAQGQVARLSALLPEPLMTTTNAKTYRAAIGAHGEFGGGWNYNVGATASKVTLDITNRNYLFLQGLLDAVAQGTYNFVDQSANSEAAFDQVFPEEGSRKTSKLWQVQGALAKDLIALPGGMLNVAVGAQYRHESLDNPSDNPANDVNPYARYYTINGVGVEGSRNIWSLSYEISAPILDVLRVKASGSYDHYSTGQKAFSPKFEAEWRIVNELKLRGTMSRGFRAPNFNKSFQLPATGYTAATIECPNPTFAAFCAAHASNPNYYAGRLCTGADLLRQPEPQAREVHGVHAGCGVPAEAEPHLHGRFLAYQDQGPDRAAVRDRRDHGAILYQQWRGEYSGHYGHSRVRWIRRTRTRCPCWASSRRRSRMRTRSSERVSTSRPTFACRCSAVSTCAVCSPLRTF